MATKSHHSELALALIKTYLEFNDKPSMLYFEFQQFIRKNLTTGEFEQFIKQMS